MLAKSMPSTGAVTQRPSRIWPPAGLVPSEMSLD